MMGNEVVDAIVIQSDGIEHARGGFEGSRRRIADAGLARHRLRNDAAELGEIHDACHLARIAKCAGRDENRVLETETAECDGEVEHTNAAHAALPRTPLDKYTLPAPTRRT